MQAAINSGWQIEKLIIRAGQAGHVERLRLPDKNLAVLSPAKFNRISTSKEAQGVLAIVRTKNYENNIDNIIARAKRVVVLDKISDPGNLGAILRTASAFDYDLVVRVGKCADVYNPKTVQATQGAIFTIPTCEIKSPREFVDRFGPRFKITIISTNAPTPLQQSPEIKRLALVLGNEISGISPEFERRADYRFKIEQTDKVESLNVAVAAGVAMYRFSAGNTL